MCMCLSSPLTSILEASRLITAACARGYGFRLNEKGGGKWPGKGGGRMWQGKALIAKACDVALDSLFFCEARKDIKVAEGSIDLGFHWRSGSLRKLF